MKLKYLITAAAASALAAGAAHAQTGATSEDAGAQPNQAHSGQHSMETIDATGEAAGAVDMQGQATTGVSADTSAATIGPDADSGVTATSATAVGADASVTTTLVTNGPIPDTPENREQYGGPNSRAGKMSEPAGN